MWNVATMLDFRICSSEKTLNIFNSDEMILRLKGLLYIGPMFIDAQEAQVIQVLAQTVQMDCILGNLEILASTCPGKSGCMDALGEMFQCHIQISYITMLCY